VTTTGSDSASANEVHDKSQAMVSASDSGAKSSVVGNRESFKLA
jgi:hypothetical protein